MGFFFLFTVLLSCIAIFYLHNIIKTITWSAALKLLKFIFCRWYADIKYIDWTGLFSSLIMGKRLLIILLYILPVFISAQEKLNHSGFENSCWNYVGQPSFAYGGFWWQGAYISMAFGPSNQPYVAFTDWTKDGKVTVMKFEGDQWLVVGNTGFSAGAASYVKLVFNPSGQPYVAYMDGGYSQKATVMKFDGINWENVGNPGFSSADAFFTTPAFNPSGELFIGYSDFAFDRKVTVKKFTGNDWVDVGNPHFSDGAAYYIYLTFNDLVEPCIGYSDYANFRGATVKRFDGTSWITVGTEGFTGSEAQNINLQLNPIDHKLYISYTDWDLINYQKVTVKKFDETGWNTVGTAGFSPGWVAYPSLKISSEGTLYVGFGDMEHNYKASVMTFDGSIWCMVGNAGFSEGAELWLNELAVNQDGIVYFAYNDRGYNTDSCKISVMKYDSTTIGVIEKIQNQIAYPNPATTTITFNISFTNFQQAKIEIRTVNGVKIAESVLSSGKIQISIKDYPNGLYLFRITKDDSLYTGKFLKI